MPPEGRAGLNRGPARRPKGPDTSSGLSGRPQHRRGAPMGSPFKIRIESVALRAPLDPSGATTRDSWTARTMLHAWPLREHPSARRRRSVDGLRGRRGHEAARRSSRAAARLPAAGLPAHDALPGRRRAALLPSQAPLHRGLHRDGAARHPPLLEAPARARARRAGASGFRDEQQKKPLPRGGRGPGSGDPARAGNATRTDAHPTLPCKRERELAGG
jgi:hypothetical protein